MKRTAVVFLLDETGSMSGYRDETISGFNEYIDTLRSNGHKKIKFTLTTFNSEKIATPYNAVSLDKVQPLTRDTYEPNYTTPLYDAIVETIKKTEETLAEKKKRRVLFVIMTDGQENASSTSRQTVFELIKEKESQNWTFVFLGANQDSWQAGGAMGMAMGNVANYSQAQTTSAFRGMAGATVDYLHSNVATSTAFWEDEDEDGIEPVQ